MGGGGWFSSGKTLLLLNGINKDKEVIAPLFKIRRLGLRRPLETPCFQGKNSLRALLSASLSKEVITSLSYLSRLAATGKAKRGQGGEEGGGWGGDRQRNWQVNAYVKTSLANYSFVSAQVVVLFVPLPLVAPYRAILRYYCCDTPYRAIPSQGGSHSTNMVRYPPPLVPSFAQAHLCDTQFCNIRTCDKCPKGPSVLKNTTAPNSVVFYYRRSF